MEYLTYEEYTQLGGTADSTAFDNLEIQARHKLDYFTHNRIQALTIITDDIKELMTFFIDTLKNGEQAKVSSYSNGVESFGFTDDNSTNNTLYRKAVEYLPVSLISGVVNDE